MRHGKTLTRLALQVLESMSDEQLQAIADKDPHDLTGLTDAELAAIRLLVAAIGARVRDPALDEERLLELARGKDEIRPDAAVGFAYGARGVAVRLGLRERPGGRQVAARKNGVPAFARTTA